jgi:hypothetical protein
LCGRGGWIAIALEHSRWRVVRRVGPVAIRRGREPADVRAALGLGWAFGLLTCGRVGAAGVVLELQFGRWLVLGRARGRGSCLAGAVSSAVLPNGCGSACSRLSRLHAIGGREVLLRVGLARWERPLLDRPLSGSKANGEPPGGISAGGQQGRAGEAARGTARQPDMRGKSLVGKAIGRARRQAGTQAIGWARWQLGGQGKTGKRSNRPGQAVSR